MEPRALESAFRVVSLAKLEPGSLQPKCQAIRFSAGHFVFRGDADDSVVLCSNNEIFDVKEAEPSNSLLIVKNLLTNEKCQAGDDTSIGNVGEEENAHEITVMKTFHHYLEMKSLMPNYQKLIQVLEDKNLNSYPVDAIEELSVTYTDLLNTIQCSETGT